MEHYKLSSKYIVLLLLILPLIFVESLPPTCSHVSSITFSGANDIIRKSAGTTVLAVFAPLQCANCYNYLRRLNDIAQSFRHVKVIVIAPDFESNHIISRTASTFSLLQIDRAGEGWPSFGAKNFDVLIINGCGQISQVLQHPASDVTSNSAVQTALENVGKSQNCPASACPNSNQYQNRNNPQKPTRGSNNNNNNNNQYVYQNQHQNANSNSAKKVNAYIAQKNQYNPPMQRQNYQQNQQQPQPNYQQPSWQPQQQQSQQQSQRESYQQNYQQQYPQQPYLQSNPQYYNSNNNNNNNNFNSGWSSHGLPANGSLKPSPTTTTTTTSVPTDSDYEDYYNNDGAELVKTTVTPQTQIPRPPSGLPNWPTHPSYLQQQQHLQPHNQNHNQQQQQQQYYNPNYPQQQVPLHLPQFHPGGFPIDSNLPCSAYTDDICFQQQERSAAPLPKCCNKGIYLTDVCVPGKCSNTTVQLCCFQKFLQAKYTCCSDPNQDDSTTSTNMFNRCCHDFFVAEDSCCTQEAAAKYWSSVYEVCYPTTHVDYSNVRFEVHFAEGVRVLDLNVNRQWEFNCTYGKNRLQYAYLP